VVTWTAEHQAVLGAARQLQMEGHPLVLLPVTGECLPDPGAIPSDAGLVSIGLANNEVGTIQPVEEIAARCRSVGALLHVDCCQGPRWIRPPLDLVDLASFSGSKLGAGSGGLLWASLDLRLEPLLYGGPQEWGRRGGHVDVGQAAGVAAALEVCAAEREGRSAAVAPLAARLRDAMVAAGGRLTGGRSRLPNFASCAFSDRRGEDLLLALDVAGIAASSGGACAAGSLDPSHVLIAMGFSLAESAGSLRLTAGYETTAVNVERAVEALRTLPAPLPPHP
jgi:cysteine desulfurase